MTNLNERLDKHLQSIREENELLVKFKPYAKINDTAKEFVDALKDNDNYILSGGYGKEEGYSILVDSLLDKSINRQTLQKLISAFDEAEDDLLSRDWDICQDEKGHHYYSWDTIDDISETFTLIEELHEILKKINTNTAKQYANSLQKLLPKIKKLWDKVPDVF